MRPFDFLLLAISAWGLFRVMALEFSTDGKVSRALVPQEYNKAYRASIYTTLGPLLLVALRVWGRT